MTEEFGNFSKKAQWFIDQFGLERGDGSNIGEKHFLELLNLLLTVLKKHDEELKKHLNQEKKQEKS